MSAFKRMCFFVLGMDLFSVSQDSKRQISQVFTVLLWLYKLRQDIWTKTNSKHGEKHSVRAHAVDVWLCAVWQMARTPVKTSRDVENRGTDVLWAGKQTEEHRQSLKPLPLSLCWSIIEWASVYSQSCAMKTWTNRQALCCSGSSNVLDKHPLWLKELPAWALMTVM